MLRFLPKQGHAKRFLSRPGHVTHVVETPPLPVVAHIRPNPKLQFGTPRVYNPKVLGNWKTRPHIQEKLPEQPTDIKGVDAAVYRHVDRKGILRKLPVLVQNDHFMLKFFPQQHHVSRYRKSNIAYTFTNYGGPVLNDENLKKDFAKYRGKYRSLEFFRSQPMPMGTAASRIIFRKRIKRELFATLHRLVPSTDVAKVSGIFFFRFRNVPTTTEEWDVVKRNLTKAVEKVLADKRYRAELNDITVSQNNASDTRVLDHELKRENTIGAKRIAGYFPKLPYLTN